MTRTKLADRRLPDYTRGEEIFNMVSHIVGGGLGIIALVLCVVFASIKGNPWAIVSSTLYGSALVFMYSVSSVYHGLRTNASKKVMQIIDHCMIYFLIGGTYTPIAICAVRPNYPAWGWLLFGLVWGCAGVAAVFTAIDLKKYSKLSMACYICMGWCVIIAVKPVMNSVPTEGLIWLLAGGIAYTIGAAIYGVGKKHRYMHSIFHLFVVLGSVLQFFCIFFYVI